MLMIFTIFLSFLQNTYGSNFITLSTYDLFSKSVLMFGFTTYLNQHFEDCFAIIKLANYYPEYLIDDGAIKLFIVGTLFFLLNAFVLLTFAWSILF